MPVFYQTWHYALLLSQHVVLSSADTLDLTFAGTGASFTAGKLRVYAIMMDVSSQGDTSANEVDRDTLA